jgi:hypothetical protein
MAKIEKTFHTMEERNFFQSMLKESAKACNLLVLNISTSDNRSYGRPVPSEFYIHYEVVEKRILTKEEIL